jgi:hypothetical protein
MARRLFALAVVLLGCGGSKGSRPIDAAPLDAPLIADAVVDGRPLDGAHANVASPLDAARADAARADAAPPMTGAAHRAPRRVPPRHRRVRHEHASTELACSAGTGAPETIQVPVMMNVPIFLFVDGGDAGPTNQGLFDLVITL